MLDRQLRRHLSDAEWPDTLPLSLGLTSPTRNSPRLHRALHDALNAADASPRLREAAAWMVAAIPRSASPPVSAIPVYALADRLNITDRQVRRYVTQLVELGLAKRATLAAGARGVLLDGAGDLLLFGINFQPLLDRADEFRAAAKAKVAERRHRHALRKTSTALRYRLRLLLRELPPDSPLHARWAALPARIQGLFIPELEQLAKGYAALLEAAGLALGRPVATLP
jgi:hypothetical protein